MARSFTFLPQARGPQPLRTALGAAQARVLGSNNRNKPHCAVEEASGRGGGRGRRAVRAPILRSGDGVGGARARAEIRWLGRCADARWDSDVCGRAVVQWAA